jgi:hypothetical protein
MANSGAMVLGIMLVGILAVALLFGSQIIDFVSAFPDNVTDWINSIRGTLPGAGGDVEGQTWIGFTVSYADGTSEEFYESAPSFSLFPFSIAHNNKDVDSVTVDLKAQLYGSSLTSWSGDVSMTTELFKSGVSTPKTSATANYTVQEASWGNGDVKVLATYTVTSEQLDNVAWTYGFGEYSLKFSGYVKLTVTSAGVPIDLTGASPSGTLNFVFASNTSPPSGFSIVGDAEYFGEEAD